MIKYYLLLQIIDDAQNTADESAREDPPDQPTAAPMQVRIDIPII